MCLPPFIIHACKARKKFSWCCVYLGGHRGGTWGEERLASKSSVLCQMRTGGGGSQSLRTQ